MKMKRILGAVLASAIVLSMAACTTTTKSSTSTASKAAESKAASTASKAESKESSTASTAEASTLKLAVVETAYGVTAWDEVKKAFEATHAGVTLEVTIDKNLEDVIGPSMKAVDYPDVIHLSVGREKDYMVMYMACMKVRGWRGQAGCGSSSRSLSP